MSHGIYYRLIVMFCVMLGIGSCGFTPVYAPGSVTASALSDISISDPQNSRASYKFVKRLEERLGRNHHGEKVLNHTITFFEEGAGLETNADRVQIVGAVTYNLQSKEGVPIVEGTLRSFTAYSSGSDITYAAREDAIERLMVILADNLVTELTAKLAMLQTD